MQTWAETDSSSSEQKYLNAVKLLELGGDVNLQQAITALREASDAGLPEASNRLGYCLEKGIGIQADSKIARDFYKKAADAGLAKSQFNYGLFLLKGVGGDKNVEEGLVYLEKASSLGLPQAQRTLGEMFYFGTEDVPKNPEKSFQHFLALAQSGDREGQNYIGTMYSYGIGTELNEKEAGSWILKSANQGHPKAQASLAEYYLSGTEVLPQDLVESAKFFMLSAKQGEVTGEKGLEEVTGKFTPQILAEATKRVEDFEKTNGETMPKP
jgi:hypothetical protein